MDTHLCKCRINYRGCENAIDTGLNTVSRKQQIWSYTLFRGINRYGVIHCLEK